MPEMIPRCREPEALRRQRPAARSRLGVMSPEVAAGESQIAELVCETVLRNEPRRGTLIRWRERSGRLLPQVAGPRGGTPTGADLLVGRGVAQSGFVARHTAGRSRTTRVALRVGDAVTAELLRCRRPSSVVPARTRCKPCRRGSQLRRHQDLGIARSRPRPLLWTIRCGKPAAGTPCTGRTGR